MPQTILIVEDDQKLQEYLRTLFTREQFLAQTAKDAMEAMTVLEKKIPDLVLLDLGLPNVSGETILREIKESYPTMKVIILTGRDSLNDVLQGFSLGADDYVKKPFQAEELLARVKARLHDDKKTKNILKVNGLEINFDTIEVRRSGKLVTLTPQEFKLLEYLASNSGHVLTREMILNHLWRDAADVETRVVDVYIGYLRKKIDAGFDQKLIHSVRGFGYMLKE